MAYRVLDIIFWEIISFDFVYFLCIVQSKEDLWKFRVEAQRAYACKQILGLGHSPPGMEYQVKVEQKIPKL